MARRGYVIALGADTTGLQKAVQDADRSINSLGRQLKEVEKGLKVDPSNMTLLAEKSNILRDEISKVSDKLKILKENQDKATTPENFRALTIEIGNTEAKLTDLNNQLITTEKQTREAEGEMLVLSGAVKSAANSAAVFEEAFRELEEREKSAAKEAAEAAKSIEGIGKQLKETEDKLKLDPTNLTLLADHAKLSKDQVGALTEKLNNMKSVQNQVTEAFKKGEINREEYTKFQTELKNTEESLNSLKGTVGWPTKTLRKSVS